ncbi:hypothetical protein PINS_up022265 [Pythium insidiosum]|nr:hypothetical protein PINS_up022265 [Pythium insidiosum]
MATGRTSGSTTSTRREGTLEYFREFLESKEYKKVWHNYSFDRHVLYNHGIDVQGLGGDTMHMARLTAATRSRRCRPICWRQRKRPMKELFGIPKLKKDGSAGKERIMPSVEELQRFPEFRHRWIRYSVFDAECTWFLHRVLQHKLNETLWVDDASMYDFYQQYIVPFGECLTDIERKGMHVDRAYLAKVEQMALDDRARSRRSCSAGAARYLRRGTPHQRLQRCAEATATLRAFTASGMPAASADVLKELAGRPDATPPRYGPRVRALQGPRRKAAAACVALKALYDISQHQHDAQQLYSATAAARGRQRPRTLFAETSTRTRGGCRRASRTCRTSPRLDKDRYKIRDAFIAPPGKKLIVADYSQLELRLLAHVTQCAAMIEAFKAGGDFHSRTAMGMYDYVAEAIAKGEALLEWDHSKGGAPGATPQGQRKNAKILNFSIAYGKTPYGLSKDFGVSRKEARRDARQVVQATGRRTRSARRSSLATRARSWGANRRLPDAMLQGDSLAERKAKAHAERAAINTPIQGAAADVNARLRELGWEMVCQIHDEIIVEGPEETVPEAMRLVVELMENPFERPLSVALEVDAKVDDSWYKAK